MDSLSVFKIITVPDLDSGLMVNYQKYETKLEVKESIPLSFITQVPKYGAFAIPGSVETSFKLADSSVEPKSTTAKVI